MCVFCSFNILLIDDNSFNCGYKVLRVVDEIRLGFIEWTSNCQSVVSFVFREQKEQIFLAPN